MPSDGRAMLDRVAAVHRWDCPALATEPPPPLQDVAEPDLAAASAGLRRPYDALRRLLGQVAGLLVLAQASDRREILDLPAIAVAREQWREVTDMLAGLPAGRVYPRHVEALSRAARLVGACLDALDGQARSGSGVDVGLALDRIAGAYRLVQSSSDDRLGLTMVDFRQSCCNCSPTAMRA
jgi:hypothetical protein